MKHADLISRLKAQIDRNGTDSKDLIREVINALEDESLDECEVPISKFSESQHFDFFGRPINIGDIVAFEEPNYRNLVQGEVYAFTPKQIRLKWKKRGYNDERTFLIYPGDVVKRDV